MPVRIYAHLSWTCWARLPLIDQAVADFLTPFLLAEARRHGARVIEIGVVSNHVHLLLELPPAYDVPRLVQGLKGASAGSRTGTAIRGTSRSAGIRDTTCDRLGSNSCRRSPTTCGYRNSSTGVWVRNET